MIKIENLHVSVNDTEILKGLSLEVQAGEVHAIMGPNGSGKSTLAYVLAGREGYEVTEGSVIYQGHNLLELDPEERAREGLFLGFQYPVEIPGVNNTYLMRAALNARLKHQGKPEMDAIQFMRLVKEKAKLLNMDEKFLNRGVNEGFSGGEKKRNEVFQLSVLEPKLAVLDETDSGLDIDALKVVAEGVNNLRNDERAIILITHYQRLLDYIEPDFVHVLADGRIVRTGDKSLALELEEQGYDQIRAKAAQSMSHATDNSVEVVQQAYHQQVKSAPPPDWLHAHREAALKTFSEHGYPTQRQEEWKYTSLNDFATRHASYLGETAPAAAANLARLISEFPATPGAPVFVFVNGRLSSELSTLDASIDGLSVTRLADAAGASKQFGQLAVIDQQQMAALNAALLTDGLLIEIADDADIRQPLTVHFLSGDAPADAQPRLLIRAGRNSRATVVEHYTGRGAGLTNAVTEIWCAEGAALRYTKLQNEAADAYHVASQQVELATNAQFEAIHIDCGSSLARNDLRIRLAGRGANAKLHGLFIAGDGQHIDHHTTLDHMARDTRSEETFRGVIDGGGRGVFNGKIEVYPGADGTDARLNNKNLLLARNAEINTKPELEIYADDVKCAHGATTGRLDDAQLFYLRSRGIDRDSARRMLINAFAQEIVDQLSNAELRDYVSKLIHVYLPDDISAEVAL